MKTGTIASTQMRDAYKPLNPANLKEAQQYVDKQSSQVKALAQRYIACVGVLDEAQKEENFEGFKDIFFKAKVDINDFSDTFLQLRYIQEYAIAFPTTNNKQKSNTKDYLNLTSDSNEQYLLHKQINVHIWQHFIEILLPLIAKKELITDELFQVITVHAQLEMYDNLIYSTSPLHDRFILKNLSCHSGNTYMWEVAKKFKIFTQYSKLIEDGIMTTFGQGLVGEISKLTSNRILDILETYHCIASYHAVELKSTIEEPAKAFIQRLKNHNFNKSNFYKFHSVRFNQLLKDIPHKLKKPPILASAKNSNDEIKRDYKSIEVISNNADVAQLDKAIEDANQNLINDLEKEHNAYLQLQEDVQISEINESHQKLLEEELEEQTKRHTKELEALEQSLKQQKVSLEQELKQQRALKLVEHQASFAKKLEERKQNSQDELNKLKQKSATELERDLKGLNTAFSQQCEQLKKKQEVDTKAISKEANKKKEEHKKEHQEKLRSLKESNTQEKTKLSEANQEELAKLKQADIAEIESLRKELEGLVITAKKTHALHKDSLSKEKTEKLATLKKSYLEKEEQYKTQQQAELDALDKAHAQNLIQAENDFNKTIITLENDHAKNKCLKLKEQRDNLLKIEAGYENTIQHYITVLIHKPYKDYLGALTQLFKLHEPHEVLNYIYVTNKFHLVLPTIAQNAKIILQHNPFLFSFWQNKLEKVKTMSPQEIISLFLLLPIIIKRSNHINDNDACQECINEYIDYFGLEIPNDDRIALTKSLKSMILGKTGLFAEYKIFQFDEINNQVYHANQFHQNQIYAPSYQAHINQNNTNYTQIAPKHNAGRNYRNSNQG